MSIQNSTNCMVSLYAGQPRLIKENWQSLYCQVASPLTLFSQFTFWDCDESKYCCDFLKSKNLPIEVELIRQPSLEEICEIYKIPISLINTAPSFAEKALYQYFSLYQAYQHSISSQKKYAESQDIYYFRTRSDLYLDRRLMKSVSKQVNLQRSNEVVFSGAQFGNGFKDFTWLAGSQCSRKVFSFIDTLAVLNRQGFFPPPEVSLKLHIDRERIQYNLNRDLPASIVSLRGEKLYLRFTTSWSRRCMALFSSNNQNERRIYDSLWIGISETIRGLPVDMRTYTQLFKRNQKNRFNIYK